LAGFGDIAVLLPLATLILLWLVLIRYPRGAAWWAIAVALCAGLTALLKIAFYGCPPIANLHSPSGHTSFSALVYGAMALVFSAEGPSLGRIFTISTAASFVLAIAASRLMLSVHSGPEVGLGLMIGLFSLAVFSHGYLPYHAARQWQFLLVIPGGGLVLALHGRELHFERFLQEIAVYFHLYCV
jgi:membrane-associated phospholipid phosphatase